jgi:signal transduction histidine kinase
MRISGICMDLGLLEQSADWAEQLDRRLTRAAGQAVGLQALFNVEGGFVVGAPGVTPFMHGDLETRRGVEAFRTPDTDERDVVATLWATARRTGSARGDVRLLDGNDSPRCMDLALLRLDDPRWGSEVLLQMRDVTNLRSSERRRIESQRLQLLGRLSGRVAHEINNPLAGLKNSIALLRRLGHNASDRERFIEVMDREVGNIAHVVRQLYETLEWGDVSRLDASITDVVQTALEPLTAKHAGVHILVDIAPDARRVATPEAVVRLLIYTLLRNAFNFSPPGGTVRVIARREQSHIELRVEDDGAEVPIALREQLSRTGAELRPRDQERVEPILGLPFAREVLEVFGGSLTIESTGSGGACFVTRWPISQRA